GRARQSRTRRDDDRGDHARRPVAASPQASDPCLSVTPAAVGRTGRKELGMAKEIDCPCGKTVRGENDDELVANTEAHIQDMHPYMDAIKSREHTTATANNPHISLR